MKKNAFTLAEIMVVLVVIGILTGILLPSAFHATPDENIMKFKKGTSVLGKVINEMVSAQNDEEGDWGKYYIDGLLNKKPKPPATGETVARNKAERKTATADGNYFCNVFADIVSAKTVSCKASTVTGKYVASYTEAQYTSFDSDCNTNDAKAVAPEIITPDGIVWYQASPKAGFVTVGEFGDSYKLICMDVDGLDGAETPFGFGIRVDGKIVYGSKARQWAKKSLQEKD